MQLGLGGPVWHASSKAATEEAAVVLCRDALADVGDAELGEWWERGSKPGLVHLRRRLSAAEQALTGDVRDIRGTPEYRIRLAVLLRDAPHLKPYVIGAPA